MFKMLIVDDNIREREGVKNLINWGHIGLEVTGVYTNGVEVLEHLKTQTVDIILSDVEMPELNGIEMLKEIRKTNAEIKVIFMSCYDEFDFAKAALNMDASGYILKPIIADEMEQLVKNVLNIHEEQTLLKSNSEKLLAEINKSMPILQENFFRELILGSEYTASFINDSFEFLKLNIKKNDLVQVVSVKIENFERETLKDNIKSMYVLVHAIREMIGEYSNEDLNIFTVFKTNYEFNILIFYTPEYEENIFELLLAIKEECYNQYALYLSMGVSNSSKSATDISRLYYQSQEALKTKFFTHDYSIILFEQIAEIKNRSFEFSVDLQVMQKEIRLIFSTYDREEVIRFIDRYIIPESQQMNEAYLKSFAFSVLNTIELILIDFNDSFGKVFDRTLLWSKLDDFKTILNIKQWVLNVFITAFEYLQDTEDSKNFKIVSDIKNLISKHYQEHLTIEDIADYIHFSVSHANKIFKEETGKTIFDYLTEFRVEKAKELLRDMHSRIYQVTLSVGYKNKSHFCMVFKQITGFSPTEYKNKAQQVALKG